MLMAGRSPCKCIPATPQTPRLVWRKVALDLANSPCLILVLLLRYGNRKVFRTTLAPGVTHGRYPFRRNNGSGSEADNQGVQEPTARSDLVFPEKPGPLEEQVPGTPGLNQAAQEPRGRCHQEPRAVETQGRAGQQPTDRPRSRER